MKFNALVPELSVTDIEQSKWFYTELLGFQLEYEKKINLHFSHSIMLN